MIKEIKIPDIGEKVESLQVVGILVAPGDMVEVDQGIVEVETSKAMVEIPSPERGKIVEVLVEEGQELKIGQAVAKIEVGAAASSDAGESDDGKTDATTKQKKEKASEAETKTDTADTQPESPQPEPAKAKKSPEKPKAASPSGDTKRSSAPAPKKSAPAPSAAGAAPASPSVRRLSRELGVDINEIEGTGPSGRITDDDVKDFVRRQVNSSGFSLPSGPAETDLPNFSKWGEVSHEPMTMLRSTIAQSMSLAWHTVPQVTQFDEADITELERFRKKYGAHIKEAGGKLTVTAILIRVITAALQRFPRFNASIDTKNKEIIYKKYINIAVAVDTENGLVVPVLKNVERKNIHELSVELTDIADRTRTRKVKPDELEGGTFTISNQGGIGGTNFTPIVYWPQVAILGVSRSRSHLEHMDGRTEPRTILPLALSYDHRIIDGADAARFLRWIVDALEHPLLLNLEN